MTSHWMVGVGTPYTFSQAEEERLQRQRVSVFTPSARVPQGAAEQSGGSATGATTAKTQKRRTPEAELRLVLKSSDIFPALVHQLLSCVLQESRVQTL